MEKIPFEKVLAIAFYALLITGIGVIGYVGMSRRAGELPLGADSGELTETSQVIALTDCETTAEKICILSTGYDADGNLLISLKAGLLPMPSVYAHLVDDRVSIRFDCRLVDISPRLLYCLGPFSGDISSSALEIYTVEGDTLIASGLIVPGDLAYVPEPGGPPQKETPRSPVSTVTAQATTTPSVPSYPSYPSYP